MVYYVGNSIKSVDAYKKFKDKALYANEAATQAKILLLENKDIEDDARHCTVSIQKEEEFISWKKLLKMYIPIRK